MHHVANSFSAYHSSSAGGRQPDRTTLATVIEKYDSQGFHRTGTEVDQVSALWLVECIHQLGLEAQLLPFPVNRVEPQQSYVHIGQRQVEGLPLFDGSFTDASGIRGKLGVLGSEADIAVIKITPQSDAAIHEQFRQLRRSGQYQGFIVITHSGRPGLALINAPDFTSPFGPPVLQVSSSEADWIESAAQQEAEVVLVAQAQRTHVDAFNVITMLNGQDPGLPPLIVMTPRSGWWQCASERGGGIACWLEVLRVLSNHPLNRDVIFLASSGHELGHLGLKSFLRSQPDLVQAAQAWVHLGANIGVRVNGHTHRLAASDKALEAVAIDAMNQAGVPPDEVLPIGHIAKGESRRIQERGGRYISLTGNFKSELFHHPDDRYPSAINIDQITRFATAFANLALTLCTST